MNAIVCFCILCLLLFIGKLLRIAFPVLQWLYLPSSIIGGAIGLVIFSCFPEYLDPKIVASMRSLPGFLINVVFATLFLGMQTSVLKRFTSLALPQLCFGQILAWGQYVIGLGLAMVLLIPVFGVGAGFGNLLEIGFEGGHGTVGGLSSVFKNFNWSEGVALGYTVATVGMVLGIIIGMALINWAYRKKLVSDVRNFNEQDRYERVGIYPKGETPSAGKQTVLSDSIDSLAWHVAIVGLAIFIGYGILECFQYLEIILAPEGYTLFLFQGFPLFPLCMFGGMLLQRGFSLCKQGHLIDRGQMQRISGATLDFLVVAALATIRLEVVLDNLAALIILITAGVSWNVFLVMFLAPKMFKEAWFERGIAEFGQSMGVTATGLLLLRTVDPENRTVASEAFGYKQIFHEPIMGGGLWTAMALTLVFTKGVLFTFTISLIGLVIWLAIFFIFRKKF